MAVGPEGGKTTPVSDILELRNLLTKYRKQPLQYVLEHPQDGKNDADSKQATATRRTVTLPPVHFVDFGFRLAMGPVEAIQPGSPAEKAGFLHGDRIVEVDGQTDFDPMRLPEIVYEHAGESTTFTVLRSEGDKPAERVSLTATPDDAPPYSDQAGVELVNVPGLGLGFAIEPKIVAVEPGSPAAKAGIKPGASIKSVTLTRTFNESEERKTLALDDKEATWPAVFGFIQYLPKQPIELVLGGAESSIRLTPEANPSWFRPYRGLQYDVLSRKLPPMGVAASLRRGAEDVSDTVMGIFAMFRNLIQGAISPKTLGGPIMIADIASKTARMGLVSFLQFLGLLSINLAVINFLPVPPLDGGQMAFLIAEKIRGRPLPDTALAAGTWIGLMLVLGLMGFVLFQDVVRYFWSVS